MTVAYVGLGANLNDARRQVLTAFDEMTRLPQSQLTARSSLYRSAPLGYTQQPEFVNAVARLETTLAAPALCDALQRIEREHGRERSFRNAPRTLDLDLLLYGAERIDSPALRVPHAHMHERAFVLAPLLEIDPDAQIPGHGSARACLERCAGQDIERLPD